VEDIHVLNRLPCKARTILIQNYLCSRIMVLLMRIKYKPWCGAKNGFFSGKRCVNLFLPCMEGDSIHEYLPPLKIGHGLSSL
jgi:hypothetical protein